MAVPQLTYIPYLMKNLLAFALLAAMGLAPSNLAAQVDSISGPLYDELARMDSVLFDAAFVTCDLARINAILTDDIEFYHDQTGFQSGDVVRDTFQRLTDSCPGRRGVRRELIPGTLRVFPIHEYGAIQMGDHRFVEPGRTTVTIAHFVHLWQRREGSWRLARVLSYDHQPTGSQ